MNTPATHRVSMLEAMLLIRAYEEALAAPRARRRRPAPARRSARRPPPSASSARSSRDDRILTNHRSAGPPARARRRPRPHDRRGDGPRDRLLQGQERHRSTSRSRSSASSSPRRSSAASCRSRPASRCRRRCAGRAGAIAAVLLRRRRRVRGHLPRVAQPRRAWQLPVLFVCENNQWQAYVRAARDDAGRPRRDAWRRPTACAARDGRRQRRRGRARRGARGRDTIRATAASRSCSRSYTYRLRGHFEPDDQALRRPGASSRAGAQRDPIAGAAQRLLDAKACSTRGRARRACGSASTRPIAAGRDVRRATSPWPDARELADRRLRLRSTPSR